MLFLTLFQLQNVLILKIAHMNDYISASTDKTTVNCIRKLRFAINLKRI